MNCYSFFSAGQLGVAIGRAASSYGLHIVNYNPKAARLQHPDSVHEFYNSPSYRILPNVSCCQQRYPIAEEDHDDCDDGDDDDDDDDVHNRDMPIPVEIQPVKCPCRVQQFLEVNKQASFLPDLTNITAEFTDIIHGHADYLYAVLSQLYQSPKSVDDFSAFYRHLHKFFGSPQHLQSLQSIS